MTGSAARSIGIVLFDDVEELDAVGPWEVLAFWTRSFPDDGWQVFCASPGGATVNGANGLPIGAHEAIATMQEVDVLLHPGGWGTRGLLTNDAYLDWIRERRATTPLMTSVCTGSLVYAAAGLLRERPATTHWASLDLLQELDSSIQVQSEARYVDDGDLITSAGVSAGIDMALHLVARLASLERAREVRRGIQYDPEPPI